MLLVSCTQYNVKFYLSNVQFFLMKAKTTPKCVEMVFFRRETYSLIIDIFVNPIT